MQASNCGGFFIPRHEIDEIIVDYTIVVYINVSGRVPGHALRALFLKGFSL